MKQQGSKDYAEITLPYITDEMWEDFNDTCLMTWDTETNRPHWTQTAVDFVAHLEIRCVKLEKE